MSKQLSIVACCLVIGLCCVQATAQEIYSEDFDDPVGTSYPQWTSSDISFASTATPPSSGTLKPSAITNVESPNGARRFLGEFGGPKIGSPNDPGWNRTAVQQQIRFTLSDLPPHEALRIAFDLCILKSWDGNSSQYGPDRLKLAVVGGPTLFDTSFSNNFKVERQGSVQDYPQPESAPQTASKSTNKLGYDFFGDATYRFVFTIPHRENSLALEFASDLFEGKGTNDESWGIDNMTVEAVDATSAQTSGDRVFEIRTYVTEPGKLDALLARFRDHTSRLFEKHGIENIGYWVPADGPHAEDTLIYVVAHPSREAAKQNWDAFIADPEWHKARDASEAAGKIVNRVESVYVNPTDFSPLK
jgi:hypothetical protein